MKLNISYENIFYPLILLACLLLVFSCDDKEYLKKRNKGYSNIIDTLYNETPINSYTHNGCLYYRFDAGNCAWGSHAGDCPNPIHKFKCDSSSGDAAPPMRAALSAHRGSCEPANRGGLQRGGTK